MVMNISLHQQSRDISKNVSELWKHEFCFVVPIYCIVGIGYVTLYKNIDYTECGILSYKSFVIHGFIDVNINKGFNHGFI